MNQHVRLWDSYLAFCSFSPLKIAAHFVGNLMACKWWRKCKNYSEVLNMALYSLWFLVFGVWWGRVQKLAFLEWNVWLEFLWFLAQKRVYLRYSVIWKNWCFGFEFAYRRAVIYRSGIFLRFIFFKYSRLIN